MIRLSLMISEQVRFNAIHTNHDRMSRNSAMSVVQNKIHIMH